MFLLNGHSLTPVRGVPAEALSLTLKERDSTASITPTDMTGIQIGSWLQDDTEPGKGIVWRVKSIRTVYATQTPTVELEHAIRTLNDRILFGETTAGDISGGATCTAKQAVQYILRQQSDWVLGQFDYNVSNPYKFDSDTLLDALETVSNSLDECWWSYDFSSYPFKLNMTRKPAGVACELRQGRNLTAITKTIDTSGMYTRMYPIGKDDLHITGDYVDRNVNLYGIVAKVDTDSSLETEAELRNWANERLAKHAEPLVTIDVEGLELADATGEPLDKLTLGRLCRVPLPEFSTNIEERITEISYQDKLHQPEVVKITLANSQEDVTRIIADNMKKSGHGGRASGRQSKEDHAWFEDTEDHVAMCAEGIVGKDSQGNPNWIRLSEIVVDGEGIHQQVQLVERNLDETIVWARTGIEQNEKEIRLEAQRRVDADQNLDGRLTVEAGKVSMIVGVEGEDYYIKAGEITLAINNAGESEAHISANKVYIGSQKSTTVINGKLNVSDFTADSVAAKIASIADVNVQQIHSERGTAKFWTVNATHTLKVAETDCSDLPSGVYTLQITSDGNTYKLQKKTYYNREWQDVGSFNSAGAVSLTNPVWATPASESPSGSSNTVTISTSGKPVEISKSVALYLSRSDSWSGGSRTVYVSHTDSAAGHRVAKIDVEIPSTSVTSQISTYGDSYPTSINGGNISKSGITAGKYMTMTISTGGKSTTVRFHVVA